MPHYLFFFFPHISYIFLFLFLKSKQIIKTAQRDFLIKIFLEIKMYIFFWRSVTTF